MEVICSSKILADFHWTAWCYIPEDIVVHRLRVFENSAEENILDLKRRKGQEAGENCVMRHFIFCTLH
jgi:hypothetical protein